MVSTVRRMDVEPVQVDAAGVTDAPRRPRLTDVLGWLTVVAGVGSAFAPVVTTRYAFSDDYPLLWMAVSGRPTAQFGESIVHTHAAQGRPLGGVLLQIAFQLAGSIDGLRFVRLVSVIAVVALALLLRWWLRTSGVSPWYATLIGTFICVTPAFVVTTSWAVLSMAPVAALLAAVASLLTSFVAADATRRAMLVLASMSLVLAFLIYPPPAMFFWVFFVVAVFGARFDAARLRNVVLLHGVVALVSLGVGGVLSVVSGRLVPTATGRMVPATDPLSKIAWFVTKPLYRSASLFGIPYDLAWTLAVGLLVVVGLGSALARRSARPALALTAGVAAVPLAFLPNLLVADSYSYAYRTGIALTSVVALLAALGALEVAQVWKTAVCRAWPSTARAVTASIGLLVTCLVAAAVVAAHGTASSLVTEPQERELAIVRDAVRALPESTSRVAVVQVPWEAGPRMWRSDELGLPSTALPWTADALVYLVLRELGRDDALPSVTSTPWWEPRPPGEVIDVRDGLRSDGS